MIDQQRLEQESQMCFDADQSRFDILYEFFMQASAPLAIFLGPYHKFVLANPAYESFVGRRVVGKTLLEVFSSAEIGPFIPRLNQVYLFGESYVGSELSFNKIHEGKVESRYLNVSYHPFRDADGRVKGVFAIHQDVTDQVKARVLVEHSRDAVENERANFKNLFRQTPEMVCILSGPDHLFEFVNQAHIRTLGFDATGKTVKEAQPESVEVHGILDDVFRTGITAHLHEIPVTVGDRRRYFHLTYSAKRDSCGVIDGVMILGVEVTEQVVARDNLRNLTEQLDRALRETESLLENSPAFVGFVDPKNGILTNANNPLAREIGLKRGDIIGQVFWEGPWWRGLPSSSHKIREACFTAAQGISSKFDIEYWSTTEGPEGGIRWIIFEINPLYDAHDHVVTLAFSGIDITERKETAKALAKAKEEAEKANAYKSAFLANMSHEIRTPLGAMMGFTELLRDPQLSQEQRIHYLDILFRNSESLSVIINDILDLSKVEAGRLTFERRTAYPEQIVGDVKALLEMKAREKGLNLCVEFEATIPKTMISDPNRVRQILLNLVGNAVKFTAQGSIKMRCFGYKGEQNQWTACFEVTDTGIGIAEEQKSQVFEAFVQADDSTTRRFGGTGLGLTVSRNLARSLGGDIEITHTQLGKGSTFLLTIPDQLGCQKENAKGSEGVAKLGVKSKSLKGIKVLVVDDSADNRHLIGLYLNRQGALIDSAENGLVGYNMALTGNYDTILMDLQMPEMDGYTATAKLREAGFLRPIIALTAHAMNEVKDRVLQAGANAHLPKPINHVDLINTILDQLQ